MPSGRDTQSCTRVCHVVEGLGYGGAERLVHEFARRMQATPFAPMVCCLRDGPVAESLRRDGILVENLNLERRTITEGPAFAVFVARVVARLRRVIDRHQVRLLHAHLHDPIIWTTAAGVLHGTPVVGTYHGPRIIPEGRGPLDPRNALRRALYRLAARRAARIICVSSEVRELLCTTLGFSPETTVLLTNGIDTAAFANGSGSRVRSELGLDGRRVVTCTARLVPHKGQAVLVDAVAELRATHPDAVLLIVGVGPERDALVARAASRGIAAHVLITSRPQEEVKDVLAASDVFVLPSFSEGIPLALIEAMAAGLPVVATAVRGTTDVVSDPSLGVLVPPGDAGALARGIARLLDHPLAAGEMALAGQAHVRRDFDLATLVDATASLYDAVLAERVSGRRAASVSPA